MPTSVNEDELVEIIHKQLGTAHSIKIKIPKTMAGEIYKKHDNELGFIARDMMQYALAKALGHKGEKEEAKQFIEKRGYTILEYDYMCGILNLTYQEPKK